MLILCDFRCYNLRKLKGDNAVDILDCVVNGTKAAADTVAKTSRDILEISRLRLTAAELTGEINKKYEALGRLVYDSRTDSVDASDMIDECVANISSAYRRLDEVNEKIATTMKRRRCSNCSAVNTKDAIYCSRCGKRMDDKKRLKSE